MARKGRGAAAVNEPDLFSSAPEPQLSLLLGRMRWPDPTLFPVNHFGSRVRDQVWRDLVSSQSPLVLAGFASITKIIELVAALGHKPEPRSVRILLGTEPFATERVSFGSSAKAFTDDVRAYWMEQHGVSLLLSAKIVHAIEALDAGWFEVRFVPGRTRLHAKIYVGDSAATVGSSNFTEAGLSSQFEANVRHHRTTDRDGYDRARQAAENFWSVGEDWADELRTLLRDMLQFVSWQEALARACADLLEGQWAAGYLGSTAGISRLWPSQVAGIAEALWVVDNVGSVLVADATGSRKTRMGAHLARAVRDRLWSTGRVRGDLTVLVCPPAVEEQWRREAVSCGLTVNTVSHGLLSRESKQGPRVEEDAVAAAQILAIDEAHNFLALSSNRTHHVRGSSADHVLMFTATPINRSAQDLLSLVDQLGADNFADETLTILDRLHRSAADWSLTEEERSLLRAEIQRFTVRRTKSMLNQLVDAEPQAYRHPVTGRICRYPTHVSASYATGEGEDECAIAKQIKQVAAALTGVARIGKMISLPDGLRRTYTEAQWLDSRVGAARGLAAYQVRAAMRSSQAALLEHIVGTEQAVTRLGIVGLVKPQPTGNMLAKVTAAMDAGPPPIELTCPIPDWLTDPQAWRSACNEELERYCELERLAHELGSRREKRKADFVADLASRHDRVLAFDHHPITLAVIREHIGDVEAQVVVATGGATSERKAVRRIFAADSTARGIALCSDAMNEGINLQGGSAVVQFDMPTTLRVAEQRVGRVDRMDSPHDRIEVYWPADSPAFATRADDLLAARNQESASLLGSNLPIPAAPGALVRPMDFAAIAEANRDQWDGLQDALEPVRALVTGPTALIDVQTYAAHRDTRQRVLARISPIRTPTAWTFLAIRGGATGAPRWLLLEDGHSKPVTGLNHVSDRLRELLADNPRGAEFDDRCEDLLSRLLARAERAEVGLLPRRHQRALDQMHRMTRRWAGLARAQGRADEAERWEHLAALAAGDSETGRVDLHQAADLWLNCVKPTIMATRNSRRRSPYSRLKDIEPTLERVPLELAAIEEGMTRLTVVEPLAQRVAACILGVPG
ncbi:SNF2-related protein [Terracoccus sp. 273MFTsu3.1]|uniref:SNF2-related protein n=1 Tax=Terracoccus sp. 273MFTsu3.1 TaxID=1172188 RepID=UPI00036391C1|nr:SNF2-related protein [Terracoccus sp. 273MFTsu3.1]